MTAYQYIQLKNRRISIIHNIHSGSNTAKWKTELKRIDNTLKEAEEDPEVQNYISLTKQKSKLQQTIGVWKRHHKDTTELESQMKAISDSIALLTTAPRESSSESTPTPQPGQKMIHHTSPTYYIINLAWSRADLNDKIINITRDFLNASNWIDRESNLSEDRGESILTWKFSYDTVEEQATVKAIKMCASHMIDTLKKWSATTDAEVFGKIQGF